MFLSRKKILFVIIYLLSFFPILTCVFDYGEWDEAGYTLAAKPSFEDKSYQTYKWLSPNFVKDMEFRSPFITTSNKILDFHTHLLQGVYPYPNLLYTYTFGSFNHTFSLAPNHHSRLIFISVLLIILSFTMLSFSFYILNTQTSLTNLSPVTFGSIALWGNSLLFATLFELKGAQLGATLLLILSLFSLYSYHQNSKKWTLLIFSVVFLFLSFLWKEQIAPLLFLFFWLFPPSPSKKRWLSWGGYFLFLGILFFLFKKILYTFSIHAGLPQTTYYYASENKAWGTEFSIETWFENLIKLPLFYFLVFLLMVFLYKKDYKEFFRLENKLLFLAFSYFIVTTVFYFYQTIDYISGLNYMTCLFALIYFFMRVDFIRQYFQPKVLMIISTCLILSLGSSLYQNFKQPRANPLISIFYNKPYWALPCIDNSSLYALNHPVLGGIYVKEDMKNEPFLSYVNMDEGQFLKALNQYKPALIMFRMDRTEYPLSDPYMRVYRMHREIRTDKVYYKLGKDIGQGIFFFVRQASPKKG